MKRLFPLFLALVLALMCVPAFAEEGTEIEVLCNVTVDSFTKALEEIVAEFTEETGIKVVLSIPGTGYEELMKTRMAANDLPDVFCTHGWAVVRYGEYLRPLNDQPWIEYVNNAIAPVITDDDGNVLVMPSTYETFGVNYNATVLEEAGVDPAELKTWSDFEAACDKILAIGKIPVVVGGKDGWVAAQFFQSVCPSFFSDEATAELAAGTYDWENMSPVIERFIEWYNRGYFNVDAVTADYNTACEYFGKGDAAFYFCTTSVLAQAWVTSPDANLHVIPMPAWEADYAEQVACSGEYLTWGVWKDTAKEEAALKFLEFLAKPEYTKIFAETTTTPGGLTNAEYDLGSLTQDFLNLGNYPSLPVWDRTLPSGMFNDMITIGQSILAGENLAVSEYVDIFQESYDDKMM